MSWRNPSQALYGIYGSFTQWDRFGGVNAAHIAGEAEWYFGRYTLQGIVGFSRVFCLQRILERNNGVLPVFCVFLLLTLQQVGIARMLVIRA